MSDERLEQGEDFELHKKPFKASDETDADAGDSDVEGHKKSFKAIDEPGSDDSDDVEAHKKSFK